MNKDNRVVVIPIVFSVFMTSIICGYGLFKGNITSVIDIAIIFGGIWFLSMAVSISFRLFGELLDDFFRANAKGKIAIALIVVAFVLKALFQISLSRQ